MKRLAEENGAKFLVLIIPDELEVNPSLLEQTLNYAGVSRGEFDLGLPGRILKDFFTENKVDYIDLLSYFKTDSQSQVLYQPQDSHFNSLGNKRVAEILYSHTVPQIALSLAERTAKESETQVLGIFDNEVVNFLRQFQDN